MTQIWYLVWQAGKYETERGGSGQFGLGGGILRWKGTRWLDVRKQPYRYPTSQEVNETMNSGVIATMLNLRYDATEIFGNNTAYIASPTEVSAGRGRVIRVGLETGLKMFFLDNRLIISPNGGAYVWPNAKWSDPDFDYAQTDFGYSGGINMEFSW